MKTIKQILAAVTAGCLIAIALPGYNIFPAVLAGIVLLLFALKDKSLGRSILLAAVTGFTSGTIYYTWALSASRQYSGLVSNQSIIIYLALSVYHSLWCSLFGAGYYFIRRYESKSIGRFTILTGSLWASWEWIYQSALSSVPWIIITPYTQWNNLYLLQWSSLGGMWIVSFIIAGTGAAFYNAIAKKNVKFALVTTAVVLLVHITGFAMYLSTQDITGWNTRFSIIQENVDAKARWDNSFVDSLAHILINLNRQAISQNPQVIAWSETAIPWTFRTDDDLVNKVLSISYPSGASQLIGMLTPADKSGDVYNSVYYIRPDGAVTGRYDKKELLAFLEKPLISSGWELPFSRSRYKNIIAGTRGNTIETKDGDIGVMICNESLAADAALGAVKGGAEVLYVAGNDGWFYGTALAEAHYALTRFRAVETRRDIVMDANRGYAGVIRSSGRAEVFPPSTEPKVIAVTAHLHDDKTFYARFPEAIPYTLLGITIAAFVIRFFDQPKNRSKHK